MVVLLSSEGPGLGCRQVASGTSPGTEIASVSRLLLLLRRKFRVLLHKSLCRFARFYIIEVYHMRNIPNRNADHHRKLTRSEFASPLQSRKNIRAHHFLSQEVIAPMGV